MAGAFGAACGELDREDVDMPCRDLEDAAVMIEQFRVAAVEYDMAGLIHRRFPLAHCLGLLEE